MPSARRPTALLAGVVSLPALRRAARFDPARLLPSGRSLALGFGLLALAVASYVGARESSVFAVRAVEIHGLGPGDSEAAAVALEPLRGVSLLSLDPGEVERLLGEVPAVRAFRYDRAFPDTLRVFAVPETPVAVVRRGTGSWLVSARARVLRPVRRGAYPDLPRIWVPRRVDVAVGATLDGDAGQAARALALFAEARIPARAQTVRVGGELTFVLRSGLEVRLGSESAAPLKLEAARRILPLLEAGTGYLDVSVPVRPVAGQNPQVEDRGLGLEASVAADSR